MRKNMTLVITGDSSIRKRLSVLNEAGFLSMVKLVREADVAFILAVFARAI